jgi:hypothetical protein
MSPPPQQAAQAEAAEAATPPLALPAMRARLLRVLACVPALAFLAMVLAPPLNHDVAAILNFAERWVGGERLYRDLIDVNPPLIFVLTAIPAALARSTPLDGVQALLLCVLGCCFAAWRMTLRLRVGRAEGAVERATLDALVPLAILLPAYDVGQREHLMALFAIPYAFLAARRIEGLPTSRPLAWTVTLAAALAFALKPHFLVVPALVEALVLLRRGPMRAIRDPLPWGMAAVWLLYLGSIPVLFPKYFDFVVPLVLGYYLETGGLGLDVLLTDKLGAAALLLLLLAPAVAWRGAGAAAQAMLAVGLGGLVSAAVQHKGWSYHVVPLAMAGALLGGMVAARWLDRALPAARAAASAPLLALVAVLAVTALNIRGESPWRQIWYAGSRDGEVQTVLRREVAGERLLILSPDIYPVYPALNYARARSTLRTMNLWLLVGAYQHCPPEGTPRFRETWEMSRPEFLVYRTVAEDFARAPPAGVLVAKNPGIPRCGAEEFDPVAYFSRHPAFAATWQPYTRVVHMDHYLLYLREE